MSGQAPQRLMLGSPGVRVLVVGSGTFAAGSRLPAVASVPETVNDLSRCLTDRAGLDPAALTTMIDPAGPVEFGAALVRAAAQATDVLMIYYVGHGLVDADNRLLLATHATVDLGRGIAAHQALPYATLREALARCAAPVIVVVLDCCFAGRARPSARAAGELLLDATPQGTYLLAAVGRDQAAWAPAGQRHTAFSGALIDLLTGGDPVAPALLTLDDVYRCLSRTLPERGFPAPRRLATDRADQQPLAPNPAQAAMRDATAPRAVPPVERPGEFSPYRGLAPFGADDADYFFGREELTRLLAERVGRQSTEPLMVTGSSGSGKSSLLRAGLVPVLRRTPGTRVTVLVPGHDPPGSTAARFAQEAESDPAPAGERPARNPAVPADLAARTGDGRRAVVIVDQFEEIFAGPTDQRQIFVRALRALAGTPERPGPVVVIGVRADYFGNCAEHPELVPALERAIVVGPMTTAQLTQAIEGPARRAELTLQAGLVDLILQDLGHDHADLRGIGVLPLLAHALLVTWQHREGRVLTLASYRATGGIHRALARTADATLAALDPPGRQIARRLLTRLVRLGDGRDDTRRTMPLADLAPADDPSRQAAARLVLDRFVQARLLTVDAVSVQIAHEALIRGWPQLTQWIEADRATLLVHQTLGEDAAEWQRHDRDPAFLYRGTRLATAQEARERWRADPGRYPALTEVAHDFLTAGDRNAVRAARRRRLSMVALVLLAVLSLTGAGVTAYLAAETAGERAGSLSRQLAAQSQNIGDSDIQLARRLATAAWRTAPTDEARASLLKAFLSPQRAALSGHGDIVDAVAFNAAGTRLATGGYDGTARLWDTASGRELAVLRGHRNLVVATVFSPDGARLATADTIGPSGPGTARLWDASGRLIAVLEGHTGGVSGVAFNRDGTRLATGSQDGDVRLWDGVTGAPVAVLHAGYEVNAVAFSPDGSRLATANSGGIARLWDAVTGKAVGVLRGHEEEVNTVAFDSTGTRLVTGGDEGNLRLWEAATGRQVAVLKGHSGGVVAAAFSPDGTLLASVDADTAGDGSVDGSVRLWDGGSGEAVAVLAEGTTGAHALAFSPDGDRLAIAGEDGTAQVWETATRARIVVLKGHTSTIGAVAFSPDGTRLATGGEDGFARLWDLGVGAAISTLKGGLGNWGASAFSADGTLVAAADRGTPDVPPDGSVRIWDRGTGKLIATLRGHKNLVYSIAFNRDGTRVATGGLDGTARVWDVATGKPVTVVQGESGPIYSVAISPDGSHLVGAAFMSAAVVWELDSGTLAGTLETRNGPVVRTEFSPDGSRLLTQDREGVQLLWDAARRTRIAELKGHTEQESVAVFSRDGAHLVTADHDGGVRLWDGRTGAPKAELAGHFGPVYAAAFSRDGTLLATAGHDGTARLWNVSSGTPLATLTGHIGALNDVTFAPDGARLATAGDDGFARVWDVDAQTMIAALSSNTEPVHAVSFDAAGSSLTTTTANGTTRRWNVDLPADPFAAVCALQGSSMTEREWAQYLHGEPYRKVCP